MSKNHAEYDEKDKQAKGITIETPNHSIEELENMLLAGFNEQSIKDIISKYKITLEEFKKQLVKIYLEAHEESNKEKITLKSLFNEIQNIEPYRNKHTEKNAFIESKMNRGKNPWDKKRN